MLGIGPKYSRYSSVLKYWEYYDLVTSRPKSSGGLGSAHGMKDTLSKNTKFSIFILMILRPFGISSCFHLSMMDLSRIKCKSNALALFAIATILLVQGGIFTDKLTDPLQDN